MVEPANEPGGPAGHGSENGVLTIHVMGSRGSGKTTLLKATTRVFAGRRSVGAIDGEISDNGLQTVQHGPRPACRNLDYLFIENLDTLARRSAGDLVPAADVVLLAVSDGDATPLKHPGIVTTADLVVVTKIDLLPQLPGVSIERFRDSIAQVRPSARVIELSAKSGSGLQHWIGWLLEQERRAAAVAVPRCGTRPPHS